jgi:hypothetical protein
MKLLILSSMPPSTVKLNLEIDELIKEENMMVGNFAGVENNQLVRLLRSPILRQNREILLWVKHPFNSNCYLELITLVGTTQFAL